MAVSDNLPTKSLSQKIITQPTAFEFLRHTIHSLYVVKKVDI